MGDRFEIRVGERTLEAAWHGPHPNEAPTLVLLHEGLGSVSAWRDWPADLAEESGFGVLVYSRFGYGNSSRATLPRPVSYMHDEAREVLPRVLEQARIERCILVGHSDGASIALIHAGSERAHPSVVGLALLSPHVFVEDASIAGIEAAREAFDTSELRTRLAKHHRDVDHSFWGWNRIWLDAHFRSWNIEGCIPKIRVPMLLVQEKDDPYGTLAQIDAIAGAAEPLTKRLILPGNGHAPWKDCREETTAAVIGFARSWLT